MSDKLKKIPELTSDDAAERFVGESDLTQYDLSGFRPGAFEFERKASQINMRVPEALLEAVKARARTRGMPFTRYIRLLMEQDVNRG